MKALTIIFLLAATFANGQATITDITVAGKKYDSTLKKNRGKQGNEFLYTLNNAGVLPIHKFNTSYMQGIGEFLEFKKTFHYAPGASDIPDETTPLQYLLTVLKRYEVAGRYKVAFLYYDAVDPPPAYSNDLDTSQISYVDSLHEEDMAAFNRIMDSVNLSDTSWVGTDTSVMFVEDSSCIPMPDSGSVEEDDYVSFEPDLEDSKKLPDSLRQVKVWYLSSARLSSAQTSLTYKELGDLEALNRQQLGVNILAADRHVRSSRQPLLAETISDQRNAAAEIREGLLPDDILYLMEEDGIDAVIIVPYGTIGQIPFQMLPLKDGLRFVDKFAFTVAPHLSNFNNINRDNPGRTGRQNHLKTVEPLIVGNPSYFSTDTLQLPNLPGAEREVDSVATLLNSKPLKGITATYDEVIKRLKTSDFAYFATHAVPSFEDPARKSFLALTPSRSSQTGFLSITDIQKHVSRRNKLVVLSACQTGVGKAYKNGYCNIGRGFFIAGVDNSIISLWNLDDENIVAYMKILVEELQKPQYFYPAENLRQAALRFKKINPNPAYWSAMVNFGVCY